MTKYSFDPVELKNWKEVPFTKGRLATQDDISFGKAVFHLDGKGQTHLPLEIDIPSLAYLVDHETAEKAKVIVIQGEQVGERKIVGIRYLSGGDGACLLSELDFIKE